MSNIIPTCDINAQFFTMSIIIPMSNIGKILLFYTVYWGEIDFIYCILTKSIQSYIIYIREVVL